MVQAAGGREQIKNELVALAQEQIGNWDNYADREFRSSEYGFEFVSRQTDYQGATLTVSKATVPGLTLDKHREFRENFAARQSALDDKLTIVECPDVDGCKALIQQIKMPMMMTNRSFPNVLYLIESEGEMIFLSSSRGTEELVAQQAAVIKKNVVANNIINFQKLTQTAEGC